MKFDPGIFAVAVSVLLFYARLAQIRGRNRKLIRHAEAERLRSKDKRKKIEPQGSTLPLNYPVGNYYLLALGIILMLGGIALLTSGWFPAIYKPYWWIPATAGMVAFIFCVK